MDIIKDIHKQRLALLIAVAIGFVSVFLPWGSVAFWGMTINASAIDNGDAWFVFIGLALAVVIALLEDRRSAINFKDDKFKWGLVIAGALPVVTALFRLFAIGREPLASASFGLFLALLVGIAIAVVPFLDSELFNIIGNNDSTK